MTKAYRLLLALCATAATLSSCSRANYAFNPTAPSYLGSQPTQTSVARPVPALAAAPQQQAAAPAVAQAAPAVAPMAPVVAHATPKAASPAPVVAQVATPALATEAAPAKPTLVQRMVLNKIAKKLAKADKQGQNTAGVAHTAAKSAGITVAIIGLIALLVGIIASSGLVITLGAIVLVVGLVLLLLGAL